MPIPCPQGYIKSGEMTSTGQFKDTCRHCGRTEAWHLKNGEKEPLAYDQALEFMQLANYKGYEQDPAFEFARVVLTRYIEWKKGQV
jgi:hypothetical protein